MARGYADSKRRATKKENPGHHYKMVSGIMEQREPLWPENPPPGDKWEAKQGLARMGLNGAEHDFMACLIDRANQYTGSCFPTEKFIAGWTNRPIGTIKRALSTLNKTTNLFGIVTFACKEGRRNRYFINWPPLFAAFQAIKSFEAAHKEERDTNRNTNRDTEEGGLESETSSPKEGAEVSPPTTNEGPEVSRPTGGGLRSEPRTYEGY